MCAYFKGILITLYWEDSDGLQMSSSKETLITGIPMKCHDFFFITSAINMMASSHPFYFGLSAQVAIWQIKQLGHRLKCQWQNLSHYNLGSWVILIVPQHLWIQTPGIIPESENPRYLPEWQFCLSFMGFPLKRGAQVDSPNSVIITYRNCESHVLRSVELEQLDDQY